MQALVLLHTSSRAHHDAPHRDDPAAATGDASSLPSSPAVHHAARAAQLNAVVKQVARLLRVPLVDYEALSAGHVLLAGSGGWAPEHSAADAAGGASSPSSGHSASAPAVAMQGLNLLLAEYDRRWRCGQLPAVDEAAMLQVVR